MGFFDSFTGKTDRFEELDREHAEEIRRGECQHDIDFYLKMWDTTVSLAKRDGVPVSDDWDSAGYARQPHTRRELRKHLPDDSPFKVK